MSVSVSILPTYIFQLWLFCCAPFLENPQLGSEMVRLACVGGSSIREGWQRLALLWQRNARTLLWRLPGSSTVTTAATVSADPPPDPPRRFTAPPADDQGRPAVAPLREPVVAALAPSPRRPARTAEARTTAAAAAAPSTPRSLTRTYEGSHT